MGNSVNFNNLIKNNAKKTEVREKLQEAATQVSQRKASGSIGATSVTQYSTGDIKGQSNLKVNDSSVFGDKGVNAKDFSEMWANSATAQNLTPEQKSTIKAQNDLLTALVDDGDGKITQEEAQKLDVVGDDGVITDEDIKEIYEQMGLSSDATIDDLLGAINKILDDTKAEEAKGMAPSLENTGVTKKEDGTYEVKVETFRGGKVQQDGDVMRYPNGSYWGIVTNAYPDIKESEKEQVYEAIGELNGFNWKEHGLYTGDTMKLPVITRDENGKLQIAKPEEPKEEEKKDYSVKHDGGQNGTAIAADGTKVEWNQGRYYVDGKRVEYDEKTGQINGNQYKVAHDGGQNGTAIAADGTKVEWNQGKYYVDGKQVNYNEKTGEISEYKAPARTTTTTTAPATATPSAMSSTDPRSMAPTTTTAPATATEVKHSEKYEEWKNEITSALKGGKDPEEVQQWMGTVLSSDDISVEEKADLFMTYGETCQNLVPEFDVSTRSYMNFPGTGTVLFDQMVKNNSDIDTIVDFANRYKDVYGYCIGSNDYNTHDFDSDEYANDLIKLYAKADKSQISEIANALDSDAYALNSQKMADLYVVAAQSKNLSEILSEYPTLEYQKGISLGSETDADKRIFEAVISGNKPSNSDLSLEQQTILNDGVSSDNILKVLNSNWDDDVKMSILQNWMSDSAKFTDAFRDISNSKEETSMSQIMQLVARYNIKH